VDRKGANRPIFEGETPPKKKITPNIGADIGAITGILLIYELFWRYEFSKITHPVGKKLL
jgi:hypothetical protein